MRLIESKVATHRISAEELSVVLSEATDDSCRVSVLRARFLAALGMTVIGAVVAQTSIERSAPDTLRFVCEALDALVIAGLGAGCLIDALNGRIQQSVELGRGLLSR